MIDPIESIAAWVDLVAEVVAIEPRENPDRLTAGLDALTRHADAQFAELSSGGAAWLDPSNLDGTMDDLPESIQVAFVRLSGDLLFTGLDGPLVTAGMMKDTLRNTTKRVYALQAVERGDE